MSNFSINDDQVNQIIKCLVKSKESYLVIARKLQINTKTVKAVGYKNIGPELFEARELEARKVLASKIKQLASQHRTFKFYVDTQAMKSGLLKPKFLSK